MLPICPPNYKIFHSTGDIKGKAYAAIMCKKEFVSNCKQIQVPPWFCKIFFRDKDFKLTLTSVYRPNSGSKKYEYCGFTKIIGENTFYDDLLKINVDKPGVKSIICGDFNLPLLDDKSSKTKRLKITCLTTTINAQKLLFVVNIKTVPNLRGCILLKVLSMVFLPKILFTQNLYI